MSSPCNPLSPDAYKWWLTLPLVSPYAFRWIPANDPRVQPASGDLFFVKEASPSATSGNGAIIHFGDQRLGQNTPFGKWHHVSITVNGELAVPVADAPPEPPEIQSTGNFASLLKARITLGMGAARVREFEFDIGAGVEFDVAAYSVNKIELLVPDPRVVIPGEPPPVGDDPGPLQLGTVLTPTVYFTTQSGRQHNPLTYTVPVVLSAAAPGWIIPRVRDSVFISAGTDEFQDLAGGAFLDFLYVPGGLREATFGPFPPFFVLDTIALPAGSTRFPQTIIPGNANAFAVRRAFESADTVINVVQILNV